jgi:hypothetical protein
MAKYDRIEYLKTIHAHRKVKHLQKVYEAIKGSYEPMKE